MDKIARKYMAHYIDTTFGGASPSWYRIGKDLEAFEVELNPEITKETNLLGEDFAYVDRYEPESEAETFYARVGDPLFRKLQGIADNLTTGNGCRTYVLEVQLWASVPGGYSAVRREAVVAPTSYGGDVSGYQIPFTIAYEGHTSQGGAFAPDGNGGGRFVGNQE